jgi:hypothetical protein
MHTFLIAVALVVGSSSPLVPQGASPDLSGSWDLTVTTARGPESATLSLQKNGDAYSGTVTRGTDQAPVEAKVKDKVVTIVITTQSQGGPFTLSGTVAADGTMSGTGEFGTRGNGQWSARRAAAPGQGTPAAATPADVSGTWALEVETPQGKGTPTFTFKQEGEKLSGQYRGQFGEAPVNGTIKGRAIEFWIDVTVEGNSLRVTYSGTVEKDSMKGTVKLGDFGEATFTGARKG